MTHASSSLLAAAAAVLLTLVSFQQAIAMPAAGNAPAATMLVLA